MKTIKHFLRGKTFNKGLLFAVCFCTLTTSNPVFSQVLKTPAMDELLNYMASYPNSLLISEIGTQLAKSGFTAKCGIKLYKGEYRFCQPATQNNTGDMIDFPSLNNDGKPSMIYTSNILSNRSLWSNQLGQLGFTSIMPEEYSKHKAEKWVGVYKGARLSVYMDDGIEYTNLRIGYAKPND